MKGLLIFAIDLYRKIARPFLPPTCRFLPSCSDYAAQAISAHGALRGLLLTSRRLTRCHPFNPGGHDPVPASFS